MSEANPVKAMRALVPEPIVTPEGVAVRPLTLGTFALLERIKSPTLVKCTTDSLALLPSLYILTHDPREVLERFGELDALAVAWADTLPPHAIGAIEAAAAVQIQRMLDVIAPEGDSKKKTTTAGSPPSCSGRARPTPGRWSRLCGAFLPRPSC